MNFNRIKIIIVSFTLKYISIENTVKKEIPYGYTQKNRTQYTEEYKELMHLRPILSHFAQYLQLRNIITAQTVRRYSGINE